MGKLFPILLLSLLMLCGCPKQVAVNPPPPPNADHSITFTWTQSFANNGACSTSVTTSCISGFNEGYLPGTTETQLHTDTASVCTGTTQPEPCTSTFNGVLPIGAVTFFVATNYLDQNGMAGTVMMPATSSPVQVGADAAASLKVTVNN